MNDGVRNDPKPKLGYTLPSSLMRQRHIPSSCTANFLVLTLSFPVFPRGFAQSLGTKSRHISHIFAQWWLSEANHLWLVGGTCPVIAMTAHV